MRWYRLRIHSFCFDLSFQIKIWDLIYHKEVVKSTANPCPYVDFDINLRISLVLIKLSRLTGYEYFIFQPGHASSWLLISLVSWVMDWTLLLFLLNIFIVRQYFTWLDLDYEFWSSFCIVLYCHNKINLIQTI